MVTAKSRTFKNPDQLVGDVVRKIHHVWPMSHDDLGEIRTETAIRSTPPEKKERLGEAGSEPKTPRKLQGAGNNIFGVEILEVNSPDLTERIFNNDLRQQINIYFGVVLCQADLDWSHNNKLTQIDLV